MTVRSPDACLRMVPCGHEVTIQTVRGLFDRRTAVRAACNRPAGHDGPHRRYDGAADILAEWTFDGIVTRNSYRQEKKRHG